MKFSTLLDKHVKIRFVAGVSKFIVNNNFFIIKCDNRIFKIDARSNDNRRILHILEHPKKLGEILELLPKYNKKDVIKFLERLYALNLIELENSIHLQDSTSGVISSKTDIVKNYGNRYFRQSSPLRILVIGKGILANNLFAHLNNVGINCVRIGPSTLVGQTSQKKKVSIEHTINSSLGSRTFNSHDLIIAAEDYPNIALFETVNKICFKEKKPWLRVSFDDNIGYLGPFVIPGKTACYNCCELRLATNSPHYEFYLWRFRKYIPKTKLNTSKIFAVILSAMCANEVVRYLSCEKPLTADNLFILDTREMNLSKHKVISHPSCIFRCHLKNPSHANLLSLNNGNKIGKKAKPLNSYSLLSDNELIQRLKDVEDEKTGIVMKTENLNEHNPLGIDFHYFCGAIGSYPLRARMTLQSPNLKYNGKITDSFSTGSGYSPNEAKIHALMEFVERYSNILVDESRLIWRSYNNIKKIAINPLELTVYDDEQYERKGFRCSRFLPDSSIPWIEGQDLYSGNSVLIGADFVYYPAIREKPLVIESSNGAASHSNVVRAILNGLYEVIERDAFLIMWLNRLSMPIIELKNLPFGFDESIKKINDFGMKVKLVDLTNDTNIPTVMAVCYNKSDKYPQFLVGAGSNIDPDKAIQKALFEMELLLIDFIENPVSKKVTDLNQISRAQDHATYYMNPGMRKYWDFMISSKKRSEIPALKRRSLENNYELLARIVKHLHDLNHRVLWVNITPPDIQRLGLKVVKVFITGFQPLYFGNDIRLSKERLNKVPAQLGYYRVGPNSQELNPALHPLS